MKILNFLEIIPEFGQKLSFLERIPNLKMKIELFGSDLNIMVEN